MTFFSVLSHSRKVLLFFGLFLGGISGSIIEDVWLDGFIITIYIIFDTKKFNHIILTKVTVTKKRSF